MVKAAASKEPDSEGKKKPTWRAIETSKALVLRPSTKGTRVSELHLKIPKTSESADLFRLKGTALLERVAKLISDHSEPAPRMALRENPLVLVKWSMKGNLVLKCTKPMDDVIKDGIKDALTYFFPSPSAEILVLNKPPTTALKFLAVPRHNLDGTDTDDMDLLNDLTAHPAWADVELRANPKFINLRSGMAGATVVGVYDRASGGLNSPHNPSADNVSHGAIREQDALPTFLFALDAAEPTTLDSTTVTVKRARKDQATHARLSAATVAETIWRPPMNALSGLDAPARSGTRNSMPKLRPSSQGAGPRTHREGFIQVGTSPGIAGVARIDTVPSPAPSPSPPASVKPLDGSIIGAVADEALRPELRGNEEARRLMQETLLDEAAFAAADAQAPSGSSGSPLTSLSYA
ncbi:hypothetical protein AX14_002626 [Amanita brunnescens Koide BX004]|nr:hypothetical protein AX14_002626 [Amanita brunnescens Koide BX004]